MCYPVIERFCELLKSSQNCISKSWSSLGYGSKKTNPEILPLKNFQRASEPSSLFFVLRNLYYKLPEKLLQCSPARSAAVSS